MSNDNTTLAPCPFCGCTDLVESSDGAGSEYLCCTNCGAEGPLGVTRADAAARWNARAPAPDAQPVARVVGYLTPRGALYGSKVEVRSKGCEPVYVLRGAAPVAQQAAEPRGVAAILQEIDYGAKFGWPAETLKRLESMCAALAAAHPQQPAATLGQDGADAAVMAKARELFGHVAALGGFETAVSELVAYVRAEAGT